MAIIIVIIELITFQIIYLINNNYYLATVISFVVGVLLNWIVGRMFVFGPSTHHPAREFIMVLIASLVGVSIQVLVVTVAVNALSLYPIIGKILSIAFSFFWNYWFRAKFIYKK
ncbi:MAG: GtrA family protein [Candidatus Saccharibacteria bacterium]